MKIGDKFTIHGYKHNGKLYKIWDEAILLDETKDYYVFANQNAKVSEAYGKSWRTKEIAILFYYKNNWFNMVSQIKKNGIYYYCNIASPVILEENTIKFIDYDLDLRIFPNGKYKILDRNEYKLHKEMMSYSEDLSKIINYKLKELIQKYKNKEIPFNTNIINEYKNKYLEFISSEHKKN